MYRTRREISMFLVLALMVFGTGFTIAQTDTDPVVVVVGDKQIKESDILNEIDAILKQTSQQMQGQIPEDFQKQAKTRFFSDALNRQINTTLLDIKAENEEIEADSDQVDAQIEQVKQQLPENLSLEQALAMQQMTEEDLRDQFRRNLVYEKLIQDNVDEPDTPSEDEMKEFYEENKQIFPTDDEVRASHILLQFPQEGEISESEKAQMKQELSELREQIENDEISFEDAAKQHSDCPSKQQGGDLNYFTKERMVPEFTQAAFSLDVDEISDVVETQFGYHLIKVTDKRKPNFESNKNQIQERLVAQKHQENVQEFIDELKDEIKVERKMSDEEWIARHQAEESDDMDQPRIQIDPDQLEDMQ